MIIFKHKLDEQGNIGRYKARLVAKGYVQKDCIDYDKTFATVFSFDVLLLLMEEFVSIGFHVHHDDISSTFLNKDIDCELFVNCDGENYKLNKSLYGFKQSSRLWYRTLKWTLECFGFKYLDSCRYVFR